MKHGKHTIEQATKLIEAMRRGKVKAFHVDHFGLYERNEIQDMVRMSKSYSRIQEHDCNGTKTKRMESTERGLEKRISAIAEKFGLKVEFQGDPRGFTVKLHAQKSNVYNTLGGSESGYGIG